VESLQHNLLQTRVRRRTLVGWRRSKAYSPTPPRNTTLGGYFNEGRFEPKQVASSEKLGWLEESLGRKSQ